MRKKFVLIAIVLILMQLNVHAEKMNVVRVSGEDRYQTSYASSRLCSASNYVIVSNGNEYEATLQSAVLGAQINAPILLSHKDNLPSGLIEEIQRLGAKQVYIVGGYGMISKSVEDKIREIGSSTIRLGDDKIENINRDIFMERMAHGNVRFPGDMHASYNSKKLVDAMVAAPYIGNIEYKSGNNHYGICNLSPNYKEAAIIFGGFDSMPYVDISQIRFRGINRYYTAISVAEEGFKEALKEDFDTIVIVDGTRLPDALSSGPISGAYKAPILLTTPDTLSRETRAYLIKNPQINKVFVIGGENSVSNQVIKDLQNLR